VKATIADPELTFVVVPITAATAGYFEAVPWPTLRDPFGRFIVATSLERGSRSSAQIERFAKRPASPCCGSPPPRPDALRSNAPLLILMTSRLVRSAP
jgi:hypothetical protein